MYENFFPETDEPEYKIEVKDVGNLALIAGAFDHFGLQSVIDSHIGKKRISRTGERRRHS